MNSQSIYKMHRRNASLPIGLLLTWHQPLPYTRQNISHFIIFWIS